LDGLGSFLRLFHFEFDGVSSVERAKTVANDARKVDKDIAARFTRDESITFGGIEPLYRTSFHGQVLSKNVYKQRTPLAADLYSKQGPYRSVFTVLLADAESVRAANGTRALHGVLKLQLNLNQILGKCKYFNHFSCNTPFRIAVHPYGCAAAMREEAWLSAL
jgi:hypothetical protein